MSSATSVQESVVETSEAMKVAEIFDELKKLRDDTVRLSSESPGLLKIIEVSFKTVFNKVLDTIQSLLKDGKEANVVNNVETVKAFVAVISCTTLVKAYDYQIQDVSNNVDKEGHKARLNKIKSILKEVDGQLKETDKALKELQQTVLKALDTGTSDEVKIEFNLRVEIITADLNKCTSALNEVKHLLIEGFASAKRYLEQNAEDAAKYHVIGSLTHNITAGLAIGVATAIALSIFEVGRIAYRVWDDYAFINGAVKQYTELDYERKSLESELCRLKTHIDSVSNAKHLQYEKKKNELLEEKNKELEDELQKITKQLEDLQKSKKQ